MSEDKPADDSRADRIATDGAGTAARQPSSSDEIADHPRVWTELTAFQRDLLAVLVDGKDYGLGIKDDLEALLGKEVNHGQLYPNLDKLVREGLVEKSALDRRTNEYELSNPGQSVFEHYAEWVAGRSDTIADGKGCDHDPDNISEDAVAESIKKIIAEAENGDYTSALAGIPELRTALRNANQGEKP